jgi:hypothetical protein
MTKDKLINQSIGFFVSLSALFIASLVKISFVIGSQEIFFSGVNTLYPLLGVWGGGASLFAIAARFILRGALGATMSWELLAFILPGFAVSLYMMFNHWTIHLLIPMACMILFFIHPVGFYATPYALFWLLPIVVYFFNIRSFAAELLASTFVGHAVGSVIWLYTVPMTASAWLALIPIVCAERLLFASAAFVLHFVVIRSACFVKKNIFYKKHDIAK